MISPHRFKQALEIEQLKEDNFEKTLAKTPKKVQDAYAAMTPRQGESARARFTRAVHTLFELSQIGQAAKSAISTVDYYEKCKAQKEEVSRAEWTRRKQEDIKAVQSIALIDQNAILVAQSKPAYAAKFAEWLTEFPTPIAALYLPAEPEPAEQPDEEVNFMPPLVVPSAD